MVELDFLQNLKIEYDRFKKISDSIDKNCMFDSVRKEASAAIVSVVHAITNCYVRQEKLLAEDETKFLRGFVYLSNCFRHRGTTKYVHYELSSGNMFPFSFPMHFGEPLLMWEEIPYDGTGRGSEGKYQNYKDNLMQKSIIDTFSQAIDILEKSIYRQ